MTKNGDKATIREVYNLIDGVRTDMQKGFEGVETKIDSFTSTRALKTDLVDLTKRVNSIESKQKYFAGAIAVLLGLLQFFGDHIRQLLGGK